MPLKENLSAESGEYSVSWRTVPLERVRYSVRHYDVVVFDLELRLSFRFGKNSFGDAPRRDA